MRTLAFTLISFYFIQITLAQTLTAYYPFNGNANDESGNGNHGTVMGAVLIADRFGVPDKAYSFNNPNHITIPASGIVFAHDFTISYWYKVAHYFGERGVFSCVGGNGGYQQYLSFSSFAYLIGYNFPAGDFFSSNYNPPPVVNMWHHLVVTYQKTGTNTSVTKLYINGDLKKTDEQNVAIGYPASSIFYIGQNHGGINFEGSLDDIRMYTSAMDAAQVSALYISEFTCPNGMSCLVTSSANEGPGTLRAAIQSISEGGTISFDQMGTTPSTVAILTSPLTISKNLIIKGLNPSFRPEITLDFASMSKGITINAGKSLFLQNVDLKLLNNSSGKTAFDGQGSVVIDTDATTEIR